MAKKKMPIGIDEFFLKSGFHKHKQSKRTRGLYYSIGGFDITKDDAINIYRNHQMSQLAAMIFMLEGVTNMSKLLNLNLQEQVTEQLTGLNKQLQDMIAERSNEQAKK